MTTPLTHTDLRQFTGDLERYRHSLARGVIYTPGVQFLAERAGAYWLIDEIALAIAGGEVAKAGEIDERVLGLHFWKLEVREDRTAVLTARADDGVTPFVSKTIPWTDFPLDHVDVWAGFDGRHWTLYLPSEH
jgi:hypothetical protein